MTRLSHQFTDTPFAVQWPDHDHRLLRPELLPAPELPLRDVLGPRLAQWVEEAAESKCAPADYVFASVVTVAGSVIGNARWVAPWDGWYEPPVIWTMCIGLPSAGKSPAMDAVLVPLREAERLLRERAEAQREEWEQQAEVAKLAEKVWKDEALAALKADDDPPERPSACNIGPAPHVPRLLVNDGTIEKVATILARQPRGILQMRDELAGWLLGMVRYAGGASDRPFWLEAYGGRGYTVERMGREPLTVERLSICVLGGIQPDRLRNLLFKTDDDGLLARMLPIWPDPVSLRRPRAGADTSMFGRVLSRLLTLDLDSDATGHAHPKVVPFSEEARELMDAFRQSVRCWEIESEGLLLSFLGKLPGLSARLALVLAYLEWAAEGGEEPREITVSHFGRAAHLVEAYILPMARRAYADASIPVVDRSAIRLVAIIRKQGWSSFTTREVTRIERAGLATASDLSPALARLEEAGLIRPIAQQASPNGGRPSRQFQVNSVIHGRQM